MLLTVITPSGRAMFQMFGVFAEFERSMIRERVMAGLSRAKADGIQLGEDTDGGQGGGDRRGAGQVDRDCSGLGRGQFVHAPICLASSSIFIFTYR
jgi:hypothetical protein